MKIYKKRIFFPLITTAALLPIASFISCNVSTKRQFKDNKLEDLVWESSTWKTLEKIIQTKFKNFIVKDMFEDYVYNNTNSKNKKWGLSELTKATTQKELTRVFLDKKGGIGNYGTDTLENVFYQIRNNEIIPKKYRHLLNQINTIYNRTINMYPTKTYLKDINGSKYIHIEFRADLITAMKRRFVKKFSDFKIDFPIYKKEYSQLELRKYFSFDKTLNDFNEAYKKAQSQQEKEKAIQNFADKINTSALMNNIWLSTILNNSGIRAKGNGLIDVDQQNNLLGKDLLNLNAGLYALDTSKNDLYIPQATGNLKNAPETYKFANWVNSNVIFAQLNKNDKVSILEDKIKEHFFTNSKMPLFKALFGKNGKWDIKVSAKTWAGNSASNYTIADWVENIGHRGDFFFYMIRKDDDSQSYYYKTSAGMAKVKEDI